MLRVVLVAVTRATKDFKVDTNSWCFGHTAEITLSKSVSTSNSLQLSCVTVHSLLRKPGLRPFKVSEGTGPEGTGHGSG